MREGFMHETCKFGTSGAQELYVPVPVVGMYVVIVDTSEVEPWRAVVPFVDGLVAANFTLDPKNVEHLLAHPEIVLLNGLRVCGEVLVDDVEMFYLRVAEVQDAELSVVSFLDFVDGPEPLQPLL